MSFRIERAPPRNSSFATPGESFLILAPSASLRKHLSDSYWCAAMELVCDGQLEGVAVRYTGENLVMLQFRPPTLSPAGYRYPVSMSIPLEFMVPISTSTVNLASTELQGSFGTASTSSHRSTASSSDGRSPNGPAVLPKLCVVCGRYNMPGMVQRSHGWKCKECKGKKSSVKLRQEAQKLLTRRKEFP